MAAAANASTLSWVPSSRPAQRRSGSSARVAAPQRVARAELMGSRVHRQGALCYIGAMPAQKVKVRASAAKRGRSRNIKIARQSSLARSRAPRVVARALLTQPSPCRAKPRPRPAVGTLRPAAPPRCAPSSRATTPTVRPPRLACRQLRASRDRPSVAALVSAQWLGYPGRAPNPG